MGVRGCWLCLGERFKEGSMLKSKMRLLSASALVGAGLLATAPAEAYNLRLGDVDIQIDTIASVGVSVRTADRETKLLPSGNGGPEDKNPIALEMVAATGDAGPISAANLVNAGTMENPGSYCIQNNTRCATDGLGVTADNFDSSINADDGRLNFDNGDITGGTFKFTSDIEARMGAFTGFARVTAFYDAVMSSDSSFERSAPNGENEEYLKSDIKLLDAYIDYEGTIGNMPFLVRAGKQVINWGEATFYLGGNNVQPSVDVAALRRPGTEIKEALLPVEALFTSIALPYDLTLEAYAGFGHEPFQLDVAGSPYAASDAFVEGSSANNDKFYIGGGMFSGNNKVNCDVLGTGVGGVASTPTTQGIFQVVSAAGQADCADGSYQSHTQRVTVGTLEASRDAYGDPYYLKRGNDEDMDGNDVGVALRWYSEALNSTEFGLYYQKYTSQIPYVSTVGTGASVGFGTQGPVSTTRGLIAAGCAGVAALGIPAYNVQPDWDRLQTVTVDDPLGLLPGFRAMGLASGAPVTAGSAAELMDMACAAAGGIAAGGGTDAKGGFNTGEMNPAFTPNMELIAEYPEDIESIGLSFNTTLLGWGVQGEVVMKQDFPLQLDTDELTLTALGLSCSARTFGTLGQSDGFSLGNGAPTLTAGVSNTDEMNSRGLVSCHDERQVASGWIEEDIIQYDIGTTATFTRSNPVISALGADLGVLLTELNMVSFDAADEHIALGVVATGTRGDIALANVCTSGTDIGLGSLFSLDARTEGECRATKNSSSGLILAQLQYNNVFGLPMSLKPTFVHQEDLDGRAPRPVAGFVEGNSRTSISVQGELSSKSIAFALAYTMFDGDVKYNRSVDHDNVSLNVSVGF